MRLSETYADPSTHLFCRGPFARPWRYTNDPQAEAGVQAACKEKLRERFAVIESKLPDDGWAVGEGFTAADAYLFPFFQWGKGRAELDMETDYPKWAKLVKRCYDLDSVKKSLHEESKIKEELGPDDRLS